MGRHVKDRLDEYLTQRLDAESRQEVERHLGVCSSCQQALEETESARAFLQWLVPLDDPPEPGPGFYVRVRESIESRRPYGWFDTLAAGLSLRLSYPVALLGLLVVAWVLTFQQRDGDEALVAMEFPSVEFATMAFSGADRSTAEDQVILSLVEMPEEQ